MISHRPQYLLQLSRQEARLNCANGKAVSTTVPNFPLDGSLAAMRANAGVVMGSKIKKNKINFKEVLVFIKFFISEHTESIYHESTHRRIHSHQRFLRI